MNPREATAGTASVQVWNALAASTMQGSCSQMSLVSYGVSGTGPEYGKLKREEMSIGKGLRGDSALQMMPSLYTSNSKKHATHLLKMSGHQMAEEDEILRNTSRFHNQ